MSAAKCSEPSFQAFVLDKHSGLIYTTDIYITDIKYYKPEKRGLQWNKKNYKQKTLFR